MHLFSNNSILLFFFFLISPGNECSERYRSVKGVGNIPESEKEKKVKRVCSLCYKCCTDVTGCNICQALEPDLPRKQEILNSAFYKWYNYILEKTLQKSHEKYEKLMKMKVYKKKNYVDRNQCVTCQQREHEQTCNICLTRQKNMIVLPCRHVICCEECAYEVNKWYKVCPFCRQQYTKISKFFF